MRNRFLALVVSAAALGLGAAPAMADDSLGAQVAEQVAGSQQTATSNANSTQIKPTNQNISVRVLSPGNDGDVTQENNSYADSYAGNENDTTQTVDQSQSGSGGTQLQEAGQLAASQQGAVSNAESTQIEPSNRNINVRVLSEGDNGSVSQSNNSGARSKAKNSNELDQTVNQEQSGGECCRAPKPPSNGYVAEYKKDDPCCHSGTGIQAAGQKAINKQYADADAKSKQVKPSNDNISVRVLSDGHDGDVEQSNNSAADATAKNDNDTTQSIDQSQSARGCGCHHGGELIQAAGQAAFNWQKAEADADSFQYKPENKALSFRFKSWGDGGSLSQTNDSWAGAFSKNENYLDQDLTQTQGGRPV